ncbi:transcriptional regulator (plasmid) [Pseudomonas aeruginosa VRFPA03]|nr:transcriptional regulator [Pseudomonas aeruginosa VRFPA03]
MHLSPESLEAFVQAVSLGSFSAAARKLGKSQSTVSEAIARLEIDLGLELFDRSGRQPQLTEAGRTLLGRVEEVLGASDRLRRVAALLAGGSEPRVTLALSDTYHSARYEARLAELDERYPELEFECLIAEDQDVIAQVSRGRATLGLLAAQPGPGRHPGRAGAQPVRKLLSRRAGQDHRRPRRAQRRLPARGGPGRLPGEVGRTDLAELPWL